MGKTNIVDLDPGSAPSMLADYHPPPGVLDELRGPDGTIRPSWQTFIQRLQQLGPARIEKRWQRTRRLVRDAGLIYRPYGDSESEPRPWKLDAIPWIIDSAQWKIISEGLQQRARLLNRVLQDIYGPQRLVKSGEVPADFLFSHPAFRRDFHGQKLPNKCFLHFYTADLARSPDGQWWVVADRTDAPLGFGYALENRLVLSRTYPRIFHECQVQRLAPFFIKVRELLQQLAPQNQDNPRTVLLSQGPSTPGYFEDAYLARYLGYTLAESGDLSVRNGKVLLKTLGGLAPVDVIMRRLSDQYADPLELQSDAGLGVAGLLTAVRSGNVLIANALGSSVVESSAMMAFLGPLCELMLGQQLKLPSVATWWCGEEKELKYVSEHWRDLVVASAYRVSRQKAVSDLHGKGLTGNNVVEQLKRNPTAYIGQEQVNRCTVPAWLDNRLVPMRAALRVYLVGDGENYHVLPGGLARVANDSQMLEYDVLVGSSSKDVWVLADEPVKPVTLLHQPGAPITLRRIGPELPSRVADNFLWLGRYCERVEQSARLLRTVYTRMAGEEDQWELVEFPLLLRQLADHGLIEPGYVVEGIRERLGNYEEALANTLLDPQQSGGLKSTLGQILRIATQLRDRLSPDSWQILYHLDHQLALSRPTDSLEPSEVLTVLGRLIMDLSGFAGMVAESMTRTFGWRFLDIGRRLERSTSTIGLVRGLCEKPDAGPSAWEAFLEVADSSMTYRSRYLAQWSLAAVLDLLLTDETNPRSVAYQVQAIAKHVAELARYENSPLPTAEQRLIEKIEHSIRSADIALLSGTAPYKGYGELIERLDEITHELPQFFGLLNARYLVHARAARTMG